MVFSKRKLKFAFLNIFIAILLFFSLFLYAKRDEGKSVAVEYTLLFTVDEPIADAFSEGEGLLDGVGKEICGKILSVRKENAYGENGDGVFLLPQKKRVFVTVFGEGKEKNGMITVGSISLLPGRSFYFHAPCTAEGLCLEIHKA